MCFLNLIFDYIRRFSPPDCSYALEYILLFAKRSFGLFCEGLVNLVLDSRQFERLIGAFHYPFSSSHFTGKIEPHKRTEGLIEQRLREMKLFPLSSSSSSLLLLLLPR